VKGCIKFLLFGIFIWGAFPGLFAAIFTFNLIYDDARLVMFYDDLQEYDFEIINGRHHNQKRGYYFIANGLIEKDTFSVRLSDAKGVEIFGEKSARTIQKVPPLKATILKVQADLSHELIEVVSDNGEIRTQKSVLKKLLLFFLLIYLPVIYAYVIIIKMSFFYVSKKTNNTV
jgi:hypothetical protein